MSQTEKIAQMRMVFFEELPLL